MNIQVQLQLATSSKHLLLLVCFLILLLVQCAAIAAIIAKACMLNQSKERIIAVSRKMVLNILVGSKCAAQRIPIRKLVLKQEQYTFEHTIVLQEHYHTYYEAEIRSSCRSREDMIINLPLVADCPCILLHSFAWHQIIVFRKRILQWLLQYTKSNNRDCYILVYSQTHTMKSQYHRQRLDCV